MTAGRFITLEGGEGAGKSTQAKLLVAALTGVGIPAIATREPGGAPSAEAIRALLVEGDTGRWDPLTEALLHVAARAEHVARTIRPALARGEWVVSDRFADSTMAYQGYGQGVGRDRIEAISRAALGDFRPDLTLVLDLPAETGLVRATGRPGAATRYERMGLPFHRALRDAFLDIARREPDRVAVIDATATVEAVHDAILAELRTRLAPPGL